MGVSSTAYKPKDVGDTTLLTKIKLSVVAWRLFLTPLYTYLYHLRGTEGRGGEGRGYFFYHLVNGKSKLLVMYTDRCDTPISTHSKVRIHGSVGIMGATDDKDKLKNPLTLK